MFFMVVTEEGKNLICQNDHHQHIWI